MGERKYDVADRILTPDEIRQARLTLNLSRRVMAEILLLSPGRGHERIQRWEEGTETISGQSSQCIRLWLAVHGLGPVPPVPYPIGCRAVRADEETDARLDEIMAEAKRRMGR